MGAGQNKDGFIDMIVETTKPFYTAGQYVDGVVHINCKASRNYRALILKLTGTEYVYWSEGSGKHRRTYSNRRESYVGSFELAIFANGIIAGGQYSFPFKFLLSSEFSGSMYENDNCYIRYPLSSQLLSSDGKNDTQIFAKYLNILQPIRQSVGLVQKQQTSAPQCCGCCTNYGIVKVGMSSSQNFVRTGDQINITGYIDNSGGKQKVEDILIQFIERRWKVSSGGAIRNHAMSQNTLYTHPSPVHPGQTAQFNFTATIPSGLVYSTAIGSILSKYHTLTLTSSMGCCSDSPICEFPLIFHTSTQKIEIAEKIPPPPIWTPMVANQVLCTDMPPFMYSPNLSMPYLNRNGNNPGSNLTKMNQGNYFQGQINHTELQVF